MTRIRLQKVRNFIAKIKWEESEKEKQGEEKGMTRLELYLLYAIHGGWSKQVEKTKEVDLEKATSLQSALKQFKADTNILRRQCVEEQHEVYLSTSYASGSRLKQFSVNIKHTMNRGVP